MATNKQTVQAEQAEKSMAIVQRTPQANENAIVCLFICLFIHRVSWAHVCVLQLSFREINFVKIYSYVLLQQSVCECKIRLAKCKR